MRALWITLALVSACSAAWSADVVVAAAEKSAVSFEPSSIDDTLELRWDSGSAMWWMYWYSGEGSWVGNDFDVSTLSTYNVIRAIRLPSRYNWPNGQWDGFRIGIFNYVGGVPGSLLWGPTFVLPTGGAGMKQFPVNMVLPYGVDKFVAAQEQFYDGPGCDVYGVDNNSSFMGHSWMCSSGTWSLYSVPAIAPYRNIMVRVIMADLTYVAPASVGRVKALYH